MCVGARRSPSCVKQRLLYDLISAWSFDKNQQSALVNLFLNFHGIFVDIMKHETISMSDKFTEFPCKLDTDDKLKHSAPAVRRFLNIMKP